MNCPKCNIPTSIEQSFCLNCTTLFDTQNQRKKEVKLHSLVIEAGQNQQSYPWRRYFARSIDIILVSAVLSYFFKDFGLENYSSEGIFLILFYTLIGTLLLLIVYEALFLNKVGTTLGKWLFGIKVQHSNGENLSFLVGIKRSLLANIMGSGLYIFSQFHYYIQLKKTNTTPWDRATNASIQYQWSLWRATIAYSSLILINITLVLASLAYINKLLNELGLPPF
ncbi:RDD family protein [Candidatus Nitrosacidococcus sp. I8]|uniref:RDD family protein n=1 Tax=Candidatus Nitrosacidococcus sp. I8 TaxID=2942908 RepID=UPI002226B0CB|nr:RDD family protein [Candidatus Nitrosacidococcus sp. I8]CAH9016122.1 hypothetical protein NURINAE_00199 [Candidatus Nitrosacidococcus sp. I8]